MAIRPKTSRRDTLLLPPAETWHPKRHDPDPAQLTDAAYRVEVARRLLQKQCYRLVKLLGSKT